MTLNRNKVNLPNSVIVLFKDKFKIRCIVRRESLPLHILLKQGMMWFSFDNYNENTTLETAYSIIYIYICRKMILEMTDDLIAICHTIIGALKFNLPRDTIDVHLKICIMRGIHTYKHNYNLIKKFSPWSVDTAPFPSVQKKISQFLNREDNAAAPYDKYIQHTALTPLPAQT